MVEVISFAIAGNSGDGDLLLRYDSVHQGDGTHLCGSLYAAACRLLLDPGDSIWQRRRGLQYGVNSSAINTNCNKKLVK